MGLAWLGFGSAVKGGFSEQLPEASLVSDGGECQGQCQVEPGWTCPGQEPISNGGMDTGITLLRREKTPQQWQLQLERRVRICENDSPADPGSVQKEGQGVLQGLEQRFPSSPRRPPQ